MPPNGSIAPCTRRFRSSRPCPATPFAKTGISGFGSSAHSSLERFDWGPRVDSLLPCGFSVGWDCFEAAEGARLGGETSQREQRPAMILLGQYDSPFVRRVAITLHHYSLSFEHRPWSVWGDAAKIAVHNPLRRVPTLLLGDGSALVETFAIIDYLDELVGAPNALLPATGPVRRDGLRIAALAAGVADKAIALLYASLDLVQPSKIWTERCEQQVVETLAVLDLDRASRKTPYWLGADLSHADIALACAYRFAREAQPALVEQSQFPNLTAAADLCETLPEFQRVYLPLTNNLTRA